MTPFWSRSGGTTTHEMIAPASMLRLTRKPTSMPAPSESRLHDTPMFMEGPVGPSARISGIRYQTLPISRVSSRIVMIAAEASEPQPMARVAALEPWPRSSSTRMVSPAATPSG